MKVRIMYGMLAVWLIIGGIIGNSGLVYADLKSADVFEKSTWNLFLEYELDPTDSLQGLCTTDDYIVCFVNTSNKEPTPDKLIAFYKNDVDENGDPVEQYSFAKMMWEMDYEHGNGMAYNPETNEIVIAGCTDVVPENKGCVFIVDAKTLEFKRKVQVSKEWNVRAIAYCEDTNRYLIQKDKTQQFDFAEIDMNFKVVNELEGMVSYTGKNTFQDFEVCGDDIICLPYIRKQLYNGDVHVYSRKYNEMLGKYQLDLASDSEFVEVESISELTPGVFVLGCSVSNPMRIALYKAVLPMAYNIETSIENGEITESVEKADIGSERTIEYRPDENYEVKEILVDDQPVDVDEHKDMYMFSSITEDHTISVKCTEIPQYTIETSAVNGVIDPSQLIRRDKDVTISYSPNEHYELDRLYVDGKDMDFEDAEGSITLKDIQEAHDIEVRFKEIPSFTITAEAKHGTVSAAAAEVYRDEDYTISFTPEEDYVLKEIYVDGVRAKHVVDENKFVFANIQRNHDIQIVFEWRYRTELILLAAAMTLTLAGYLALLYKRSSKNRRWRKERKEWKIDKNK